MKKRFVPSPAIVIAIVALTVASISPATAAVKKLIGTKDLKNGAVTTAKIKKGAVTKDRLAQDALQPGQVGPKGDIGAQGPKGEVGPKGDAGVQGLAGTARGYALVNGTGAIDTQKAVKGSPSVRRLDTGRFCVSFADIPDLKNQVVIVSTDYTNSNTRPGVTTVLTNSYVTHGNEIACNGDEVGVISVDGKWDNAANQFTTSFASGMSGGFSIGVL